MNRSHFPVNAQLRSEDLALMQREIKYGISMLSLAAYGPIDIASGFGYTINGMNITILLGSIYRVQAMDAVSFDAIAADQNLVLTQFTSETNFITGNLTAGNTYYVYGTPVTAPAGSVVRNYVNTSNPAQSFVGATNNGIPEAVQSMDKVTVAIDNSIPTGAVPIWTIAIPVGTTTITAAMIVQHVAAPVYLTIPQLEAALNAEVVRAEQVENYLKFAHGQQNYYGAGNTQAISFVVPIGVYFIKVKIWGVGGGGGHAVGPGLAYGGGGGGYLEDFMQVTPGQVIPGTLGGIGAGGSTIPDGIAGGDTSFGPYIVGGGQGGSASTTSNGSAGAGGSVKVGSATSLNLHGLPGGVGAVINGIYIAAPGGSAFGTLPSLQVFNSNGGALQADSGSFPGGGGNGGATSGTGTYANQNGGYGASPLIAISW